MTIIHQPKILKTNVRYLLNLILLPVLLAVGVSPVASQTQSVEANIRADIWVDNWFALYLDNRLIQQDSVAFDTERSFNKESFEFNAELPARFSIIVRDFLENDTGLEYIGSRRQQMGDGGFRAQFFNSESGELIGSSDERWHCLVIHDAPLNTDCERDDNPAQTCQHNILPEPIEWKSATFDDSAWPNATVHSSQAVRPHGGYNSVDWRPESKLIWSENLKTDNTLLCRFTIK